MRRSLYLGQLLALRFTYASYKLLVPLLLLILRMTRHIVADHVSILSGSARTASTLSAHRKALVVLHIDVNTVLRSFAKVAPV